MDGSAVVTSAGEHTSGVDVAFVDADGVERFGPLARWWGEPFELASPFRSFAVFKGQRNLTGLYWAATSGSQVGYESWVERDAAMTLDFDPAVVALASQPFRIAWTKGEHGREHTLDYFARLVDGTGVVVDVHPKGLLDEATAEVFEFTARVCEAVGWQFRHIGDLNQPHRIESAGYVPLALNGDDYVELLPATWRAVNSYGIKVNTWIYDCPELAPFRRQPSGVTRKRDLWEIHRDPYDANWLWVRNHWETGWIQVPWKHLGSVPQPFGDLAWDHAAADLRRKANPTPTEEQTAQAVVKLLVRAGQGPPDRESPADTRASRRGRRVAARTRAAAESTGPRPPRSESPQPATDAEHPRDDEAVDGTDDEPIAAYLAGPPDYGQGKRPRADRLAAVTSRRQEALERVLTDLARSSGTTRRGWSTRADTSSARPKRTRSTETKAGIHRFGTASVEKSARNPSQRIWSPQVTTRAANQILRDGTSNDESYRTYVVYRAGHNGHELLA